MIVVVISVYIMNDVFNIIVWVGASVDDEIGLLKLDLLEIVILNVQICTLLVVVVIVGIMHIILLVL